jgi:hypothetical protein
MLHRGQCGMQKTAVALMELLACVSVVYVHGIKNEL